jgi:antitoxin component of RelBE/YafQ-DinJ toxin-antitoxin module
MESKPEKNFPLRIDTELLEEAKKLAKKRGISTAGLFRQLLIRELEEERKK